MRAVVRHLNRLRDFIFANTIFNILSIWASLCEDYLLYVYSIDVDGKSLMLKYRQKKKREHFLAICAIRKERFEIEFRPCGLDLSLEAGINRWNRNSLLFPYHLHQVKQHMYSVICSANWFKHRSPSSIISVFTRIASKV